MKVLGCTSILGINNIVFFLNSERNEKYICFYNDMCFLRKWFPKLK